MGCDDEGEMMLAMPDNTIFLVRVAQSVTHQMQPDRQKADALGRAIAEFVVAHWDRIVRVYDDGQIDELELMERAARDLARRMQMRY
ncbi:MAG: hypothetical protein Kow00124_11270 [Anaerolineae bacterium]